MKEIEINTRTLLREFKTIKQNLIHNTDTKYVIKNEDGTYIEISLKEEIKPKTGAALIEALKTLPKIKIKRYPELMDEFDLIGKRKWKKLK
jgi:hypothetical protein